MRLARSYLEGSDGTTELQEGWYLVDPKVSMQCYTKRCFLFALHRTAEGCWSWAE